MSDIISKSKFLSLVLRHDPKKIGLTLDQNGWANVQELLQKLGWDMNTLEYIVATNNKKRFAFNADKTQIRANQGHSINVDLQLTPKQPPDILFHGTADTNVQSILSAGLDKRNRQYVHLSSDTTTARKVGERHGNPEILEIDSKAMNEAGFRFFLSDNGVWLTDFVHPKYIKLHKQSSNTKSDTKSDFVSLF